LLVADRELERRQLGWRTPIMPVAVGLYLPFGLGVAILIGSLARKVPRWRGAGNDGGPGLLFAAGMVAGEALMGVAIGAMVTTGLKLPLFH
jgi:uncharacterized oligopeptide transporter (OPT) family protein